MTRIDVFRMIKRRALAAGLPYSTCCHTFRDGQGGQTPSSKKLGFAAASADLEIFKLLYEYRFLAREHFSLLTGRNPTSLHYRLKKLADNGYLNDLKVAKQPGQKHIYSLGKPALRSLVEKGIAADEVLIKRLRTHELKPLYLNQEKDCL